MDDDKEAASIFPDLSLNIQGLTKMSSPTRAPKNGKEELSCVICVGSTGAGKSATIQRCTKQSVLSGNGHDRVTNKCSRYDLTAEAKADLEAWPITKEVIDLTWVDTVGWDDADQQGNSWNLSAVAIPIAL